MRLLRPAAYELKGKRRRQKRREREPFKHRRPPPRRPAAVEHRKRQHHRDEPADDLDDAELRPDDRDGDHEVPQPGLPGKQWRPPAPQILHPLHHEHGGDIEEQTEQYSFGGRHGRAVGGSRISRFGVEHKSPRPTEARPTYHQLIVGTGFRCLKNLNAQGLPAAESPVAENAY
jgi:hypothetical protein